MTEETYVAGLAEEIASLLAEKLDQRPLLSARGAGERLGISERGVKDMIANGTLAAIKVGPGGGSTRIEAREIDAYLAARRASGDGE